MPIPDKHLITLMLSDCERKQSENNNKKLASLHAFFRYNWVCNRRCVQPKAHTRRLDGIANTQSAFAHKKLWCTLFCCRLRVLVAKMLTKYFPKQISAIWLVFVDWKCQVCRGNVADMWRNFHTTSSADRLFHTKRLLSTWWLNCCKDLKSVKCFLCTTL